MTQTAREGRPNAEELGLIDCRSSFKGYSSRDRTLSVGGALTQVQKMTGVFGWLVPTVNVLKQCPFLSLLHLDHQVARRPSGRSRQLSIVEDIRSRY